MHIISLACVKAARLIIWNRVFVVFRTEKGESLCKTFLTEIVESGTKNYCLSDVNIFTKALERWNLGLFWKFGTSKEYTQWLKKNTNLSWQNCDIVRSSKFWLYANGCGDTADSAWVFNDASYRIPYHGWLVALRGKLSHVARRGMIAFCQRKGVLKNVNMLTISKSSRS